MVTKILKLNEIKAAEYNPRRNLKPEDEEYQKLKRSIETFGFVEPLIVNERTMTIVGGHQRYKILRDLGITETEAVIVMPRKAKRPCRYRGCPRLTDLSSGYCAEHEKLQVRAYDKSRRVEHNQRYGSKWRKLRNRFLAENPLCEQCKSQGRYTIATEVHHIKPLSEGGTNDVSNLMPLCKSCHSRITLTTENLQRG